jgi:16S rRNA (guanine527-N7)-methyltransferase
LPRGRRSSRVARPAPDPLERLFKAFPALLGRSVTPVERNAFGRYADLLILWNRTHHLTALKTRAEIGRGLFLDSLLFRAFLPQGPLRVLDIGAGPGIPGVPLRMVEPALSLTLIESKRKPVSFLNALARELGMADVVVRHGRAEDILIELPELEGKFDFVLSRAVGLRAGLIDTAMTYLRPGGSFLASGPPVGEAALSKVVWEGQSAWRRAEFPRIGMSRMFFMAIKGN